jgi:hypothetical protein
MFCPSQGNLYINYRIAIREGPCININCKTDKNICFKDKNDKLSPDAIYHSLFDSKGGLVNINPVGEIILNPNISKVKLK